MDRRIKINTEAVEIIILVHVALQDEAKVSQWLRTKNPHFGNIEPLRLMQLGRGHKVKEFIEHQLDERETLCDQV